MPKAASAERVDAATKAAISARESLASNLRAIRAELGLSQAEVAARSGLSLVYITKLEGLRPFNPTLNAIAAIAHALECTPDALLVPAARPEPRGPGRPSEGDEKPALRKRSSRS